MRRSPLVGRHLEIMLEILADRNVYVAVDNTTDDERIYYKIDYERFVREVCDTEEYRKLERDFIVGLKNLIEHAGGIPANLPLPEGYDIGPIDNFIRIFDKLKSFK